MSCWFLLLHVASVLMSASRYEIVVLPVNLGDASGFNRTMFPLSFYRRDSLGRGDFYLEATLGEMHKIRSIGTNAQQWASEILNTTKARYDHLMLQKAELEQLPRSRNPFRAFANYRAARMFLAASKSLYVATRSRSEEMTRTINRDLLSVPGKDVEPATNDLPPGTNISGIAVKLDHSLDDETRQQIATAAYSMATSSGLSEIQDDQTTSSSAASTLDQYVLASESLSDSETDETIDISRLPTSSAAVVNNYYFHGSIYSPNSNVHGATVQQGGSGNSGSVNHEMRLPGN